MILTDPLRYDNQTDVHRRLDRTFVIYKGRPIYVTECFEDLTIKAVEFPPNWNGDEEKVSFVKIHSSDVEIDLESPKMGWANVDMRGAVRPIYFFRTVHRQFSQGIDPRKVHWMDPTKDTPDGELHPGFAWRKWEHIIPFAKMFIGEGYPSIAKAAEKSIGAAFHRDWALVPTKSENFRTIFSDHQPIGTFNRSTNVFEFVPRALTKVRRMQLDIILHSPENFGVSYGIAEQA